MWSSLRTAVTGIMAQQRALDVAADNLTKLQTPGAKSQRVSFLELAPELRYLGVPDGEGNVLLEARETGKGVRTPTAVRNLAQGQFLPSGDSSDVAVDGEGFFEVTMSGGETAYTRGGSLRIDGLGRVQTAGGLTISPEMTVPPGSVGLEARPDGTILAISQEGARQEVGKLKLVRFVNPDGLQLLAENVLVPTVASGAPIESAAGDPGVGMVVTGIIEASNVNPREEYTRVMQAQRAYQLNVQALKTVDEMLQDANNLRRQ
jgi:flagellar basal-body rod protein FlgG